LVITVTLSAAVDSSIEAPRFAQGGVVSGRLLAREASGKGINLARYLKVMGVDVEALALVGEAELAFFDGVLDKERIAHKFVGLPGSTRNNITLSDPVTGLETHIRHPGLAVEKHHIEKLNETLADEVSSASWVAFSGGAPPGLTTGDYRRLLEAAEISTAQVAVDTSGPYLKTALELGPTFIKPNVTELSELLGVDFDSPDEIASASRGLLNGVRHVVVSCGAEGAVYVCEEGAWHSKANVNPKRLRGTVGCGDAVVAGFIAGMIEGLPAADRLARAVACGSAAALWPSAGHVSMEDVRELQRSSTIRAL